jgi:hypothetical protein
MAPDRKTQLVLAAIVVALVGLIYRLWPASAAAPLTASVASPNHVSAKTADPGAPDVHLEALQAERPKPADVDRNLFRFLTKPAPVARPTAPPPSAPVVSVPPSAPSTAPITLKFIGIVEAPERTLKVAVLSDQYGVYYGREGETILGQYKILHIGTQSLDISFLDGRGRQTIRLNGT